MADGPKKQIELADPYMYMWICKLSENEMVQKVHIGRHSEYVGSMESALSWLKLLLIVSSVISCFLDFQIK